MRARFLLSALAAVTGVAAFVWVTARVDERFPIRAAMVLAVLVLFSLAVWCTDRTLARRTGPRERSGHSSSA